MSRRIEDRQMTTYQANTNQWKDGLGSQGGKGFRCPINRELTIHMQGGQSPDGLQLLRPSGSSSAFKLRPYSSQTMTKHEGVLGFCHFCSWNSPLRSHLCSRVSRWVGQDFDSSVSGSETLVSCFLPFPYTGIIQISVMV